MPANTNHYVYLGLLGGAGVALIVGLVLFIAAISFEGYIAALMVVALAGCCYAGARELKTRQPQDTIQSRPDPEA